MTYNVNRGKQAKPAAPRDFLHFLDAADEEAEPAAAGQTETQQRRLVAQIAAAVAARKQQTHL